MLVAMALAGCASDRADPAPDPSATPAPSPSAVALASIDIPLIGITQLGKGDADADRKVRLPNGYFTVGKSGVGASRRRSSALLAFEGIPFAADCIESARLSLFARGGELGPVKVYPSAARSVALGRLPSPENGGPGVLLDNQPSSEPTPFALGEQAFDVTDLVRLWVSGGPFPSLGKTFEPDLPIVLNVRPPDLTDGTYTVEYASTARAPRLVVERRSACR